MALSEQDYKEAVDRLTRAKNQGRMTEDEYNRGRAALAEQYAQTGPDLDTFETMLNKLTGAKMEQQGQIAAARRGDIYAGGLANMMSNF